MKKIYKISLVFACILPFMSACLEEDFDIPIAQYLYEETFEDSLGLFTTQNVTGDQIWEYSSSYSCAVMSGYSSSSYYANEDWLISPAIDLSDGDTTITLSFDHAVNYDTDMSNLTLWASTDYTGDVTDPSNNWIELTVPNYPDGTDFDFISSGSVGLDSIIGNTEVTFAFKYVCGTSSAATWEINNFQIQRKL